MKIVHVGILILCLFLVAACQSKNNEQEQSQERSQEAISEEQETYDSMPVFNHSTLDVYEHFKKTAYLSGTLETNKGKDTTTFMGDKKAFYLYTNDYKDNQISQFFTKILKPNFLKKPKLSDEVLNGYKAIFELIDVPYNEEKLLLILETDVAKDRENKTDSYYEDLHVYKYDTVWMTIEGIYNSNNEPKPNYFEVRIWPKNPLET